VETNEERIVQDVIERYGKIRRLRRPIDHGLLWDLSHDAARDYYHGEVDRRYVESRIFSEAEEIMEARKEKRKGNLHGETRGGGELVEDEIASLSVRELKARVRGLYRSADKLVEIDMKSNTAISGLYSSELERRGYSVVVEPDIVVSFNKQKE
jgi:hypothetical protein